MVFFGVAILIAIAIFGGYVPVGQDDQQQTFLEGDVEIWGILPESFFTGVIQAMAKENENKLFITYEEKDPETFVSEIINALAVDSGPDLIVFPDNMTNSLLDKMFPMPYTSFPRSEYELQYVDAAQTLLGGDGVYGLPFAIDPLVMYYNKDILSRNFMVTPPGDWESLYDFALEVTEREGLDIDTAAVGIGSYSNVNNAKEILSAMFFQVGNPIVSGGISTLDQDFIGFPDASEEVLRTYLSFADPDQKNYSWNISKPDTFSEFAFGKLAVYFGFASEAPAFLGYNPNLNVGTAMFPQWSNLRPRTYGRLYSMGMSRTVSNPELAFAVMWRMAGPGFGPALASGLGLPPADRNFLGDNPADPNFLKVFVDSAIVSDTWVDPDVAGSNEVFRSMVEDSAAGIISLERAILRARTRLTRLLR